MNTAIIVAAGTGTRFGGEKPKQFVEILGKSIVRHTLERFAECSAVDEMVLIVSAEFVGNAAVSNFKSEISKLKKIVAGGETRSDSVRNGLAAIDPRTEVVAVHDGARPLVLHSEIAATIQTAQKKGAACLVGRVTDTIKSVRGDEITGTLDRDRLRRALTPQAFQVNVLRRAFEMAEAADAATDECYLVEKLGYPIAFVEGSNRNIKITVPEDIVFAEAILRTSVTSA